VGVLVDATDRLAVSGLMREIARDEVKRQPCWTEILAVGNQGFMESQTADLISAQDRNGADRRRHVGATRGGDSLLPKSGREKAF
jgi:hypothetical protein